MTRYEFYIGLALSDRVTKNEVIDEAEWKSTSLYLRKLYSVGDDMKYIAKTMDTSKRSSGEALAKDFQDLVKLADKPAIDRNYDLFSEKQKKSLVVIDEFLALLQDVPDEI
uniref:Uncharacterized protein n=1 Tax=Corethron hystrix TaxID=216773 RepID=A0A7S1B7N1_9STRA|mmetsp:Transcript_15859/g.35702  ORF Transcript_15859/g.35702 Transcript_15859/m.35702 type:complete len:111 (+) Transcript_15859:439-771(+)